MCLSIFVSANGVRVLSLPGICQRNARSTVFSDFISKIFVLLNSDMMFGRSRFFSSKPFYLLIHLFRVSSLSLLHGAIYSLYRCEETIRRCFFSSFYWCLFYLFFHSIGPVYCFIILDLYVCEHQVVVLREFWPMQSLMAVALESNQSCPTLSVQSLLFYRWPRPPIEK